MVHQPPTCPRRTPTRMPGAVKLTSSTCSPGRRRRASVISDRHCVSWSCRHHRATCGVPVGSAARRHPHCLCARLVEHGLPLSADIPRRGSRHTAAAPLRRCAAGALPPFVALLRLRRNAAPHSGRVPPFAPPRRWLARRSPHNGAPRIECGAMRCPSSRSAATQRGALHCISARCAPGGRSPNGRGTGEKGLNRRPTRRGRHRQEKKRSAGTAHWAAVGRRML
jgi:hypothetical protein